MCVAGFCQSSKGGVGKLRFGRYSPRVGGREPLRADQYERLHQWARQLLAERSLEPLLDRLQEALVALVPHDALTVYLAAEDRPVLVPARASGPGWETVLGREITVSERIRAGAVAEPAVARLDGETVAAVPLVAHSLLIGACELRRGSEAAPFSGDELELARLFAEVAALALDNARTQLRLIEAAGSDPLTGLANRRSFEERLTAELARVLRSREPLTLLVLDLDKFKQVNDTHGHGVGDQLLVELARYLRRAVRSSDLACRLGGDEFALIMPACDADAAEAVAARLADRFASLQPELLDGLTLSIGAAHAPAHATEPDELFACADLALLEAKAAGGNRSLCFGQHNRSPHTNSSQRTPAI